MSSAVSAIYCGQVSPKIFSPFFCAWRRVSIASISDMCTISSGASTRRASEIARLVASRLGDAGVGDGVELGRDMALLDQMVRQPVDHVVVLGMHHDQRAVAPRQRQDVEHLVVADLHAHRRSCRS